MNSENYEGLDFTRLCNVLRFSTIGPSVTTVTDPARKASLYMQSKHIPLSKRTRSAQRSFLLHGLRPIYSLSDHAFPVLKLRSLWDREREILRNVRPSRDRWRLLDCALSQARDCSIEPAFQRGCCINKTNSRLRQSDCRKIYNGLE